MTEKDGNDRLPPDFSGLRRRAEEKLAGEAARGEKLFPADAARLIHELRVHQIELEMQNEELRQAQSLIEESRNKYADLYDFAPVGYLTLDSPGMIVEANLTATILLGVERRRLLGRLFPHFLVEPHSRTTFRQMLANSGKMPEQRAEFLLKAANDEERTMLMNLSFFRDAQGRERHRLTLTDISELKQAQEALEESQEKLRRLTEQLLTVQELERQRISRDLHDELGQALMVLKMNLNAVKKRFKHGQEAGEEFDRAIGSINGIADRVRNICQSLRPSVLEDVGLTAALKQLLAEFQQHHGFRVSQDLEEVSGLFSPAAQVAVYRIFQECLTNAARHGKATRVRVQVRPQSESGEVSFLIEDNGSGFDPAEVRSRSHQGQGLIAMAERVRLHQGFFEITTAKGKGTRIAITLPPDK